MTADRNSSVWKQQTALVRIALLLLCAVLRADGSTVVYDLGLRTGTGGFSLKMEFHDNIEGNENAIRGTVTLTPGTNTGDIVAVYINLNSSLSLSPLPPLTQIRDAIEGVHITSRAIHTSNVQGGNIGAVYSIGLAIGQNGIGNGKGDIQALSFLLKTPGLTLQHLSAVAARVTSVGPVFSGRGGSAKYMSDYGQYIPDDVSGVPEPETWFTAGLGICVLLLYRHRARAA